MLVRPLKIVRIRRLPLLLVCACLLLSGCRGISFTLADGESLSWSDLRGQWVFINYWAPWCKPCIEEIPQLNKAHAAGQAGVLGVTFDQPGVVVLQQQMRQLSIEFPVLLHDPAGALGYSRPQVLPATLIFDPQGLYQGVLLGPQTVESLSLAQRAYALDE
jgi:thiol-disulfide isomerase/thioredoxin